MHPDAFGTAFHALVEATSPQHLSLPAYQPCLGAVQTFIARQAKKVTTAQRLQNNKHLAFSSTLDVLKLLCCLPAR